MTKKTAQKIAKPLIVQSGRTPPARRKIAKTLRAYEVRTLPHAGNSGRLGVVEINGAETTLIARYHTLDTAAWVRDVMQAAAKA